MMSADREAAAVAAQVPPAGNNTAGGRLAVAVAPVLHAAGTVAAAVRCVDAAKDACESADGASTAGILAAAR